MRRRPPTSAPRLARALALLGLASLACGDDRGPERDIVARVAGEGQELELERSVVEQLAAREGISEAEARSQALETLRLVAMRRAELAAREHPPEHPDDLDPARREQLERAALVRLWLDEVFEPSHRAADIPRKIIEQNLADPSRSRRLFHPQLWFVCQALVVPSEKAEGRHVQPPSEGEAAAQWRAAAEQALLALATRIERMEADLLLSEEGCMAMARVVETSKRNFDDLDAGAMTIRFEHFAFAPSEADKLDREWLDVVSARAEPGLVGPFPTQFGLHLVLVDTIEPAALATGSLPEDELLAAREAVLREEIEQVWQADQFQQMLADVRDRRIVRLSPELERGP